MKTMDGNTAATHVTCAMSDVVAICSTPPGFEFGDRVAESAAGGPANIFGQPLTVRHLECESGAVAAVCELLATGLLSSIVTDSRGLLLIIPDLYQTAGKLLPAVFHVAARSAAGSARSIFGDHQDVMAVRQTGLALLASASVQEVMDLGLVGHLAAIESSIPFLHFFDGFRTSREIQKIEIIDYADMRRLVDREAAENFRLRGAKPSQTGLRGAAQSPDSYFQGHEAANPYFRKVPTIVNECMKKVGRLTGRNYRLFDYVGHPKAEKMIVAMASSCETIEEVINHMVANGQRVGLVKVRLYRPFSPGHLFAVVPASARRLAVLDRTRENGSLGGPLYQDVCTSFMEFGKVPKIVGGRYGLGPREFNPPMVKAVFDNLDASVPVNHFTVGLDDHLPRTSLAIDQRFDPAPGETMCCKFWGLDPNETAAAHNGAIKIVADHTALYVQGCFTYDSHQSRALAVCSLRFGKTPIRASYQAAAADYIACHDPACVDTDDVLAGINIGGTFVLNSSWSLKDMDVKLPARMRRTIARKNLKFCKVDAAGIASGLGLGGQINFIMQAAFFKLANIIPVIDAVSLLKTEIKNMLGRQGEKMVRLNCAAVDQALENLREIRYPPAWACAADVSMSANDAP